MLKRHLSFFSLLLLGAMPLLQAAGKTKNSVEPPLLPGKKGACFTLREAGAKKGGTVSENMPKVKALNVSWNYSWGTRLAPEQPKDIEFIPMSWGGSNKERLKTYLQKNVVPEIISGNVHRFLAFNEPDKKEQANMPYMKAIELWPVLEKLNVPLCSPSCANPEGIKDASTQGVPGTWMKDFMDEAEKRKLRVDYVGAHWYGGSSAKHFKAKMRRIYEKYGRRPLLITEFAPADWKTKGDIKKHRLTPAKVLSFMKDVLPWMEKQDWIYGYAWFSFKHSAPQGASSSLFDDDGKLTACGRYYRSVTPENPKGDQSIKPDPVWW